MDSELADALQLTKDLHDEAAAAHAGWQTAKDVLKCCEQHLADWSAYLRKKHPKHKDLTALPQHKWAAAEVAAAKEALEDGENPKPHGPQCYGRSDSENAMLHANVCFLVLLIVTVVRTRVYMCAANSRLHVGKTALDNAVTDFNLQHDIVVLKQASLSGPRERTSATTAATPAPSQPTQAFTPCPPAVPGDLSYSMCVPSASPACTSTFTHFDP